ncbi:MAG TPA: aspartate 1-decarboxylase [Spirochaetia bacterium]|nr:aspartate 1-decarboxylase [Spirochaetia bacterium]
MFKQICTGKIHRATVTEANLNYEGSLTVDETLMKASGMVPNEMVQVTNVSNGAIWRTYLIPAPAGSGTICLNGSSAHHFKPGDLVIIMSYGYFQQEELPGLKPQIVLVDGANRIKHMIRQELPFTACE